MEDDIENSKLIDTHFDFDDNLSDYDENKDEIVDEKMSDK